LALGVRDDALVVALLFGLDALLAELLAVFFYVALGGAHLFVGVADGINQPLARALRHVELADLLRDLKPYARDLAPEPQELLRFLAAQELLLGAQLVPFFQARLEVLADV